MNIIKFHQYIKLYFTRMLWSPTGLCSVRNDRRLGPNESSWSETRWSWTKWKIHLL